VVKALARTVPQDAATDTEFSAAVLRATLDHLRANFDASTAASAARRSFRTPRSRALPAQGEAGITELTLRRMCRAGSTTSSAAALPLQHRRALDIPHFEKMLYDNGPLLACLPIPGLRPAMPSSRAALPDRGLDPA